jgi:gliding motility-associated-like protein
MGQKASHAYKQLMKRSIVLLLLCCTALSARATHNRAGEITFRHITALKYEITVTTYTEIGGSQADRPFLPIDWGDNSGADSIARLPNPKQINASIQQNVYIKTHEFSGPGRYTLAVEDPNRNAGINNIPNSVAVPFYIESELIIDAFAGHNNSVRLLNAPIDFACVGFPFVHNPSAFDPDGDSLHFSLVEPKGFNGIVIPGYTFPNASRSISIHPTSGELLWDHPLISGEYNIAILVKEFKNGIKVGEVLRDMQITVGPPCQHRPPVFDALAPLCVTAGDDVQFQVSADDAADGLQGKDGSTVNLSASGGVFLIPSPAKFELVSGGIKPVGQFFWETACANVRKSPYQVVFKAVDNGVPNLSSFQSVEIEVVAPAPEQLTTEPQKNSVLLTWEKSACDNAIGYRIYRRLGGTGFVPAQCETGVPERLGYELITTTNSIETVRFLDDDESKGLILGLQYCYLITAIFEDGAESYASKEVCASLKKELPVITNVNVDSTSFNDGVINVAWSKPTEHDTVVYPGPYRYLLRRKFWNDDFIVIDSTATINDTLYDDKGLNTEENEYTYIIDMYDLSDGRTFMGSSVAASSLYLNSLAEDNKLVIQWSENVPWINRRYVLYKKNSQTDVFEMVDTVTSSSYVDDSLSNGVTYCYKLESIGEYLVPGLIKPILNFSQIHCNVPIDTVPPCAPIATIDAFGCGETNEQESYRNPPCASDDGGRINTLSWTNPNTHCGGEDEDVVAYKVYFKPQHDMPYELIHTALNAKDTIFEHIRGNSIAGCYVVTAIDSFANESVFKDSLCVDNCPVYVLPNVFSPGNNDGYNDYFKPFPYCFIESVNFKLLNRWGMVIFETTDPDINWDGINQKTGQIAAEGVYYYVCEINRERLNGSERKIVKGFVQLFQEGTSKGTY